MKLVENSYFWFGLLSGLYTAKNASEDGYDPGALLESARLVQSMFNKCCRELGQNELPFDLIPSLKDGTFTQLVSEKGLD